MSNDVRILLPAMVAIMLAKWVADAASHPLYHALLEIKCVPFLPSRPVSKLSLDLVEARYVMHWPVVTLRVRRAAAGAVAGRSAREGQGGGRAGVRWVGSKEEMSREIRSQWDKRELREPRGAVVCGKLAHPVSRLPCSSRQESWPSR